MLKVSPPVWNGCCRLRSVHLLNQANDLCLWEDKVGSGCSFLCNVHTRNENRESSQVLCHTHMTCSSHCNICSTQLQKRASVTWTLLLLPASCSLWTRGLQYRDMFKALLQIPITCLKSPALTAVAQEVEVLGQKTLKPRLLPMGGAVPRVTAPPPSVSLWKMMSLHQ